MPGAGLAGEKNPACPQRPPTTYQRLHPAHNDLPESANTGHNPASIKQAHFALGISCRLATICMNSSFINTISTLLQNKM